MISTDVTDILFGPETDKGRGELRIFKEDEVNLIVHGHEPLLAEILVDVVGEPEMIEYAKQRPKGINLGGMCCTANEVLMSMASDCRRFTNQELGIMTGLVTR